MPAAAPLALRQQADPHWLLTDSASGWNQVRLGILRPIPLAADGSIDPHVQLDAVQWVDFTFAGTGNADQAISQLDHEIAARGSALYAYGIFSQDTFDALGLKVTQYRLVIVHSQVQLLGWAIVLLAAAFAFVICIQYVTTGHSPAVDDLKGLWGSAVTSVGDAAGNVGQAIATPYLVATIASGAILLVLARVGKESGVRAPTPKSPSGSISAKVGPATVKAGT